jgi:subtilase family serine protease
MKRVVFLLLSVTLVMTMAIAGGAQDLSSPARGTVIPPPSAPAPTPRLHLPLYIFIPEGVSNPASIPNGETPGSIACIYGVVTPTLGCLKSSTIVPTGGAKAIAVVDFGHYSAVQSDLDTFSAQFGLPSTTIQVICTPGPPPCPNNAGTQWDLETALDVQWAHAMAPHAKIILAEFTNDPIDDGAETQAAAAVAAAGGGEVSNSWTYNGGEDPSETQLDHFFTTPGVVYFGSAGDAGLGPAYPSISPNVISAGGTRVVRDSSGNFTGETCWSGSGGGISQFEIRPTYQVLVPSGATPRRGTPDLAGVADPSTGVDVFSSTFCHGWCIVGGTSASSPILAGIVNQSGTFRASTVAEQIKTYGEYGVPALWARYFRDVTVGSNGAPAKFGWDQCTGIGSTKDPSGY